ncbi:hypothetical protein GCM10022295_23810 [Streptomyces osmaniensis]|uniref:Uncharacterized protein n=1 Tax=Streptomyces osmaniensis TaxID=593134 RepID=A0ABP6VUV0_9ACTN
MPRDSPVGRQDVLRRYGPIPLLTVPDGNFEARKRLPVPEKEQRFADSSVPTDAGLEFCLCPSRQRPPAIQAEWSSYSASSWWSAQT